MSGAGGEGDWGGEETERGDFSGRKNKTRDEAAGRQRVKPGN